ncbi:MAG: ABC transporter permease subunit [Krumholzibacteria bacterium]|nr:ABC transporter permease subunit [Candidatus Krumholzibacteria bacterium]
MTRTTAKPAAPAPSVTPNAAPTPLPSVQAVLWLALFSLREMARRRRLISLALINLLPVLVVAVVRIWFPGEGITAQLQLTGLTHEAIIPFLVPIVAMAVGVSAIGEQIEEGTIVYTWTRPIRRRAIYLGRLLAAQVTAAGMLSASLVLCFLVMVSEGLHVVTWEFLRLYLATFAIIALGAWAYTALFAAVGTHFKKPVFPAIIFAFGWENMVTGVPARVQELSLRFHLQNLVDRPPTDTSDLPGILGAILTAAVQRDPVPRLQSVVVLLVVGLAAAAVGVWLLKHKEIDK